MSSILKALRRLEEERARKSPVAPEIAASLLRHDARRRQSPLWLWPALIIAVTAVAAALLWSWRSAPVTSQIVTPAASPATIVASAATVERGGEVIIEEVIEQRQPVLLPPQTPAVIPAPRPVKVNPPAQKIEPAAIIPPVAASKPAAAVIEERQSPVVSAIAWQEESSARMAVVDGLPVMTGEFVGTAQVQEIRRDHILFVEAGTLFTVALQPQ